MRTISVLVIVIWFTLPCSYGQDKHLPLFKDIGIGAHGSLIGIFTTGATAKLTGELIAVDSSQLYILIQSKDSIVSVPLNSFNSYRLQYAAPRRYLLVSALMQLVTISHGFGIRFSLTANFVVSSVVAFAGYRSFIYTEKDISLKDLHMFSRFPQGIPEDVPLKQIR